MRYRLHYISHGQLETGGYQLEKSMATALAEDLENCSDCYRETRFRRQFKGPLQWLLLAWRAFCATNRHDQVITVARLAWPVWLKLRFGSGKMLLVLHNDDQGDGKPALYHRLLQAFLKLAGRQPHRIRIVTVARCWQQHMEQQYGLQPLYFPNLFDPAQYAFFAGVAKTNSHLIHLGQYSAKADQKAYLLLIHELKQQGYACYFSSNEAPFESHLPISFFTTREAYLKQMALSACTIILNRINEGWNRVAHESMLLNTPVICRPGGGLEELVTLGGGHVLTSVEDIVRLVESGAYNPIRQEALTAFDSSEATTYIKPISEFIRA